MGKARSIALDTQTFAKAGDATLFFSGLLQRYKLGDRVSDEDEMHLHALLKRHDEADKKRGTGVAYFSVDSAPEPYSGQRCFWITREDGSRIDISYQHCLEKKPYD
ncbi:DCL family protein [Sphingomonas sp. PAMC 26605]|uniref:DCL family protein n=1 Tax=Sphingomonas sp. PAMC 26605 TaxID=1112214 RepID=UPI00026CA611|nr:DCL family protein [Sphingomonas sp. PAMC 26605]